jgi:hypothetical protein
VQFKKNAMKFIDSMLLDFISVKVTDLAALQSTVVRFVWHVTVKQALFAFYAVGVKNETAVINSPIQSSLSRPEEVTCIMHTKIDSCI